MDVTFGQHDYTDLSNLNAKWDEDRPAVAGLGTSNGILSGNLLGIGSDTDPHYPWREESPDTMALQKEVNKALRANGYQAITEDGKLGPGTCGAVREMCTLVDGPCEAPGNCQEFTPPQRAGGGGMPTTVRPELPVRAGYGGGPNWLVIGGAVGAIAIGAALVLKKKRRR